MDGIEGAVVVYTRHSIDNRTQRVRAELLTSPVCVHVSRTKRIER